MEYRFGHGADAARVPWVDPDVDLHDPGQRAELVDRRAQVLGAIALGGVVGAVARGLLAGAGHPPPGFPTATLVVNVSGSLLLGVLMAVLAARPGTHRLVRPFLGVGVLGGFTTFSTYAVDVTHQLEAGRVVAGLATMALTPVLALAAAWAGTRLVEATRR